MKKDMSYFLMKFTWLILENEKGEYRFNIYNPFAYAVLIVVALASGTMEFLRAFTLMFKATFRDSVQYGWEGLIIIGQFGTMFYAIYLWLL